MIRDYQPGQLPWTLDRWSLGVTLACLKREAEEVNAIDR